MRLNIAIFFGALFGALGVLLFLVAFGSDYWLLATEVGKCSGEQNIENVTFHHEGFFWRCWFNGIAEENDSSIWKFWYTNQPPSKNCMHAYLSPYPFTRGEHNSTSYDSAVIYRGFWAVLMLLGVVAVVTASFLIICAAPFASHVLYKAGGGGYIAAEGRVGGRPFPCPSRCGYTIRTTDALGSREALHAFIRQQTFMISPLCARHDTRPWPAMARRTGKPVRDSIAGLLSSKRNSRQSPRRA
ncbi:transmembrane protein 182 isoform X2 [Acinonyx jubatus]|uniref:Transmembrane protein 182 n=1 Tax=Acinonyx jubatus TaxID=32536 RepID=A0ABM3NA99_ACIJB|nr:transmembrane protein 182 isoform X2 [Acinonyx jubatus]